MTEYLAPGVFVQETASHNSIEGVSTTTAGFVGPARYGPVKEVSGAITSLREFERVYGGGGKLIFADDSAGNTWTETHNYLWHSVRAFFEEGGKRLFISRVFRPLEGSYPSAPASAATPNSNGLYADGHGRATLGIAQIRSRFPGKGSNLVVRLTLNASHNILEAIPNSSVGETPFPAVKRFLPKLGVVMDHDVVLLSRKGGPPESTELYLVSYSSAADEYRFIPETGGPPDGLRLEDLGINPDPTPEQGDSLHVLTMSVNVLSPDGLQGTWSELPLDPRHLRGGALDCVFARFSEAPPTFAETQALPLVISNITIEGLDGFQVLRALFPDATTPPTEHERERGLLTVALRLEEGVGAEPIELKGGHDGLTPGPAEYEGKIDHDKQYKTGLKQLEDIDEIAIVAAPGSTATFPAIPVNVILNELISHAERMRYRIAVLDSPPGMSVADVRKVKAELDSKYAAFYYPWVTVMDPITASELNLPPSGFVAGIYVRNDIQRGVWKAPANEVVNLAISLEQSLTKTQQDLLNPEGINCFRFFEGRGFRLWGARTTSSDPEWKYVNVRRYFAYLEHSIDKGTQWAVFEPNGESLWANVRRAIEDFLLNEWQSGALLGDKPQKAYFVKCDRSTMTQNDLDNGRLICLIGIAPVRPAEFVIFRIGQWTADRKR